MAELRARVLRAAHAVSVQRLRCTLSRHVTMPRTRKRVHLPLLEPTTHPWLPLMLTAMMPLLSTAPPPPPFHA